MEFKKPVGYKNVSSGQMGYVNEKFVNTLTPIIATRVDFKDLLDKNEHVIVFKFGAVWCKPCTLIKKHVETCVSMMHKNVICLDLDVDDSFDLYAYLKSKKQVNGIPCLLAYKKGNTTFAPDASISGANNAEISNFFNLVNKM